MTVESQPGVPDERGLRRGDVVVLLIAMTLPTFAAWMYFDAFVNSRLVPVLYGVGKTVQFVLPVVWVFWVRRERLPRFSFRGAGAGALLGVAIVTAFLVVYFGFFRGSVYLSEIKPRLSEKLQDFQIASPGKFIVFAIGISLAHSILEEYYWRWFVFGQLRQKFRFLPAALISSLAFMAHHVIVIDMYMRPEDFWTVTLFFSGCVAVGGLLWAWLYERSGSLLGPWVSHVAVDAAIMAVGYGHVF